MSRRAIAIAASVAMALLATTLPGTLTAAEPRVEYEPLLSGLDRPVRVVPGGRKGEIFVAEQGGTVQRLILEGGTWRRTGTFLDISGRVDQVGAGRESIGLLGLVFHPNYRKNGRFYVAYTQGLEDQDDGVSIVSEFRRKKPKRARSGSERVVLRLAQPNCCHLVHGLAFGKDGYLYIGSGDGKLAGAPQARGSLYGKILRIDPRDPDGKGPKTYRSPRSNPYVGTAGRDEIWMRGLRNPWSIAFDEKRGDMWVADPGQLRREEVDIGKADRRGRKPGRGLDFGWDHCEGTIEFTPQDVEPGPCTQDRLPIFDYARDRDGNDDGGRCAAITGRVLRGKKANGWDGLYVAPDFCGAIFVLDRKGNLRHVQDAGFGIVAFGYDRAGRVFALHREDGELLLVRVKGPRPTP